MPASLREALRARPSLRAAGFEDSDSTELAEVLSDVAFCARWLAVLSASEVRRTKRLVRHRRAERLLRTGLSPFTNHFPLFPTALLPYGWYMRIVRYLAQSGTI